MPRKVCQIKGCQPQYTLTHRYTHTHTHALFIKMRPPERHKQQSHRQGFVFESATLVADTDSEEKLLWDRSTTFLQHKRCICTAYYYLILSWIYTIFRSSRTQKNVSAQLFSTETFNYHPNPTSSLTKNTRNSFLGLVSESIHVIEFIATVEWRKGKAEIS